MEETAVVVAAAAAGVEPAAVAALVAAAVTVAAAVVALLVVLMEDVIAVGCQLQEPLPLIHAALVLQSTKLVLTWHFWLLSWPDSGRS